MHNTLTIDQRLRRYVLPTLLLAITLLMAVSLYFGISAVRQHSVEIAAEGARDIFRIIVLTRQWNAEHGGVYVFTTEKTPVNAYLDRVDSQLETTDHRFLTLLNPAYMTREIAEMASKEQDLRVRLHITSLKPIRPENKADAWESQTLSSFEQGVQEVVSVERESGNEVLRFMAPLMVKQACLACHAKQGYQLGDVRGGISVSLQMDPINKAMQADIRASIISHGVFYTLLVAVSWGLIELLARRWRSLDETIETLKATRDELVETEKMASLGRLVAGFAHEINTPIGIAVGAVSHGNEAIETLRNLFKQEEVSEKELIERLDDLTESHELALANLRRGAELVHRFKRTSIDQASQQKRKYQLYELIQDVLLTLRNTLKNTDVTVDVDCPLELELFGTPGLLEQVLINLIINSVKHGFCHGKASGEIHITVRQSDHRQICIDYYDNGVGINEDIRHKVFEPFFSTSREQGGSGLGLYVVYNIITQQMGGNVRVESAPGGGVSFHIEFPVERSHM